MSNESNIDMDDISLYNSLRYLTNHRISNAKTLKVSTAREFLKKNYKNIP
jgi:hypothetical protein